MSTLQSSIAAPAEHMRGVFSSQEIRKVGTGTTTRKTVQKTFWFVDQDDRTGEITIQALNNNYIPTGMKKNITREELVSKYSPEVEFYIQTVFPKMKELTETVESGDIHREKGETFSAENEYASALEVDEENVRANFGIGITYLTRGEKEKADNIFERLVTLEAAFTPEHKHLFNDFGINLRKNQMYDQALDYYQKALTLGSSDDNLYLNIARVQLEKKMYIECVDSIKIALLLDSKNTTAQKMLSWLEKKKLISTDLAETVRAEVKKHADKMESLGISSKAASEIPQDIPSMPSMDSTPTMPATATPKAQPQAAKQAKPKPAEPQAAVAEPEQETPPKHVPPSLNDLMSI